MKIIDISSSFKKANTSGCVKKWVIYQSIRLKNQAKQQFRNKWKEEIATELKSNFLALRFTQIITDLYFFIHGYPGNPWAKW